MAKKLETIKNTLDKSAGELRNTVASIRREIEATCEELTWLKTSALPKAEALARIAEHIDAEAARFDAPGYIGSTLGADRSVRLELAPLFESVGRLEAHAHGGVVTGNATISIAPLMAWLHGAALKARIAETLDGMDYQPGPGGNERMQLISDADEKIRALEIQEEQLIEAAEEIGIAILRRADVDPAIVLGLEIIETEVPDKPYKPVQPREAGQPPRIPTESQYMQGGVRNEA